MTACKKYTTIRKMYSNTLLNGPGRSLINNMVPVHITTHEIMIPDGVSKSQSNILCL